MLKKALVAGTLLRHAIQLSAGRSEKIRRRGAVLQPGNGYERFGPIHVNFRGRKISGPGGAFARIQRILEIACPRRQGGCRLRVGKVCGARIASGMLKRMSALPDQPAEKKNHKKRNDELRVRRHSSGATTAAAMMTMMTSVPMRAAGRDRGSQMERPLVDHSRPHGMIRTGEWSATGCEGRGAAQLGRASVSTVRRGGN